MRKLLSLASLVIVLSGAGAAGQAPVFTPYGIIPILDAYLEALRQQAGVPGMSAALVRDGAVLWEKGYGFQNVTSRIRATPDTPYMVGELSGTLAAVLVLQCVEQGHLELDRPLGTYGIDIPEPGATLRQILSHTFATADPAVEPFVYNPARYGQLTAVMEHCAPQPYRKSISHRILNFLAMKDSVPGTDLENPLLPMPEGQYELQELLRYRQVLARQAVGYRIDLRGRMDPTAVPPATMAANGGLVSTVRDLARFDGALDRRLLLLDETLGQAWNPVPGSRGLPVPTGLGWFVQSYRGQRVVWHFGVVPNAYSSLIIKLPERNLTLILLANSDRLNTPFQLQLGDVSRSLFATLFLKLTT
jgi:CubicO group peptidase (beta-lactamase class C family)